MYVKAKISEYFGDKQEARKSSVDFITQEEELGRKGIELDNETKPLVASLIIRTFLIVPGLGKVFEERLHEMLNQDLILEIFEERGNECLQATNVIHCEDRYYENPVEQ